MSKETFDPERYYDDPQAEVEKDFERISEAYRRQMAVVDESETEVRDAERDLATAELEYGANRTRRAWWRTKTCKRRVRILQEKMSLEREKAENLKKQYERCTSSHFHSPAEDLSTVDLRVVDKTTSRLLRLLGDRLDILDTMTAAKAKALTKDEIEDLRRYAHSIRNLVRAFDKYADVRLTLLNNFLHDELRSWSGSQSRIELKKREYQLQEAEKDPFFNKLLRENKIGFQYGPITSKLRIGYIAREQKVFLKEFIFGLRSYTAECEEKEAPTTKTLAAAADALRKYTEWQATKADATPHASKTGDGPQLSEHERRMEEQLAKERINIKYTTESRLRGKIETLVAIHQYEKRETAKILNDTSLTQDEKDEQLALVREAVSAEKEKLAQQIEIYEED